MDAVNGQMTTWIEHVVSPDVRVLAILAEKPRRGRPALTYTVEAMPFSRFESFEEFDAALQLAQQLADKDRSRIATTRAKPALRLV